MKVEATDVDPSYHIENAWRDHLVPLLRSAGFKGSGRQFRRIVNQFAECVSLQGSRSGDRFAVNLGVQPLAIPDVLGKPVDPRKIDEISCEFRRRLSEGNADHWWPYTQLVSSKVAAAQSSAAMFERFGLAYFHDMTSENSPLLRIDPISFDAGIFDFRGFNATKVRMSRALSLLRLASGDISASRAFARVALNAMGAGKGLKSELEALAGLTG
jgi:hypothetical protein